MTIGMDLIGPRGDWHRRPDSFVPRLAASAAHTRGKRQVMSETYGAAGWDLTAEEVRRLADWQFVRGVTRLVPHAFYYSIEGPRYHECPPSFFWQSPLWPYMPGLVSYMTRWTWLLENTRPVPGVAVYYPIDAVREVTSPQVPRSMVPGLDETQAGEAGAQGIAFRRITDGLFRAQVDYDVVDDSMQPKCAICVQRNEASLPADLARVVAAWDHLSEALKAGILAMVETAQQP